MPHTHVQRGKFIQAYKLNDGSLAWCLALPHPSNKKDGFKWQRVQKRIQKFLEMDLTAPTTKQRARGRDRPEEGARGGTESAGLKTEWGQTKSTPMIKHRLTEEPSW